MLKNISGEDTVLKLPRISEVLWYIWIYCLNSSISRGGALEWRGNCDLEGSLSLAVPKASKELLNFPSNLPGTHLVKSRGYKTSRVTLGDLARSLRRGKGPWSRAATRNQLNRLHFPKHSILNERRNSRHKLGTNLAKGGGVIFGGCFRGNGFWGRIV